MTDHAEALKPFARFIEHHDGPNGMQSATREAMNADSYVILKLSPGYPPITLGDFRRARDAIAGLSAPEKPFAYMTLAGFERFLRGSDAETHVLMRGPGNPNHDPLRVALYATPPAPQPALIEERTEIASQLIAKAIAEEAQLEALRAKVETLTAALEEIRDMPLTNPVAVYEIARTALAEQGEAPQRYRIEHDGFVGTKIGEYQRLDGKRGVVLQQDGTNIVHVYGIKWLIPVEGEAPQPIGDTCLEGRGRAPADYYVILKEFANELGGEIPNASLPRLARLLAARPKSGSDQ
ncbi:hypothetical protein [Allomesorhizobium alhagi]|uniref:Uncharacterized protein n=1 Tax=Mesorhizobium alhagi CCNWXJ12-2 TaxID=1107882 RepID=H0HNF0_9HYPH|nr:hypothetical protein [Mesorhizobium alhagi]EHK57722.1 hypothetical protein MAXJ12_08364 [Mesorhizobium alhagi CCNWXJ12-2]